MDVKERVSRQDAGRSIFMGNVGDIISLLNTEVHLSLIE